MTPEDDSINISVDDIKAKTVGEILSNDSSRKILQILSNREMTANQISQEAAMSIALVAFHLKKMQEVEIVKISKTKKSVKGQEMKYYSGTKKSLLITPAKTGIFESVKRYSKFAAVGIAGILTWLALRTPDAEWNSGEEISLQITDPDTNPNDMFTHANDAASNIPSHSGAEYLITNSGPITLDRTVNGQISADSIESFLLSLVIPSLVVVAGIVIERLVTRFAKRRSKY